MITLLDVVLGLVADSLIKQQETSLSFVFVFFCDDLSVKMKLEEVSSL